MTEDEMAGWDHRLNGHEFGWTLGVGDGQGAWRAPVHGVAESWTIKNAECQKIDAFELWCWRRVLRIP